MIRRQLRESYRMAGVLVGAGWRASPWLFTACAVTGLLASITSVAYPVGYRYIVDGATDHHAGSVIGGVLFVAACFALGWMLRLVSGIQASRLNDWCNLNMFQRIGRLVSTAPYLEHFEDPDRMAEIDALRDNRRAVANAPRQVISLAQQAIQVAGVVVLLALVYPPVLVVPLLAVAPGLASRRASQLEKHSDQDLAEDRRMLGELFRLVSEASSARELRTFGVTDVLLQRHAQLGDEVNRRALRAARRAGAWEAAGWLVYAAGFVGAIVVLVLRAAHGHTSPGAVVEAVSLMRRAQRQVSSTTDTAGNFATAARTARRLLGFEDYVNDVLPAPDGAATAPVRLQSGITFDHVNFSYPSRKEAPDALATDQSPPAENSQAGPDGQGGPDSQAGGTPRTVVLDDVDLHLPAGSTVAVVGENGAGKTTLVKLLTGMYRPTSGRILVDGVDLAGVAPADWRLATTATFQDFMSLQAVLADGVGIGDLPNVDDRVRIATVLDRADATELVASLPRGADTLLGSYVGGAKLSGGQWQRLALARGLMRTTPLLVVLDEPTASLDAPTEASIFNRYREAARQLGQQNGAVTVLVSHRFSTVHMADLIVVVDGGRVVESGDHASLLQAGGLYAELFGLQARAYLSSG